MPWFKVDDNFAMHPDAAAAGNTALGLWVRAGAWSAQMLTDGFIPRHIIVPLGGRLRDATVLVNCHLWLEVSNGWQFANWSRYQPSADEVRKARNELSEKRSQAGKKGMANRWQRDNKPDNKPITNRITNPQQSDSKAITPSRPVPEPTTKDDGSVLLHLPTEPREIDGVTTLSAVDHG